MDPAIMSTKNTYHNIARHCCTAAVADNAAAGNNSLPVVVGNNCSLGVQDTHPSHDGGHGDGVPNRDHVYPSHGRVQTHRTKTRW